MRYFFTISTLILFTYCGVDKSNDSDLGELSILNQHFSDSINKTSYENLYTKYNAIKINKDSFLYTYELENIIDTTSRPFLIKGSINDIIKSENGYQLLLSSSYFDLHFKKLKIKTIIKVDSLLFEKLKSQLHRKSNNGTFVIKVKSIVSLYPMLVAENNLDDDIGDLNYDFREKVLKFKGDLIDFFINNK